MATLTEITLIIYTFVSTVALISWGYYLASEEERTHGTLFLGKASGIFGGLITAAACAAFFCASLAAAGIVVRVGLA